MYVCALVGVLIKWLYEMHNATIKMTQIALCDDNLCRGATRTVEAGEGVEPDFH